LLRLSNSGGAAVNRAQRRGRKLVTGRPSATSELVIRVDEAIDLNSRFPLPGLAEMLLGIRRDYGPATMIGLDPDTGCVQVYL
jgi:hypothetical protein